LVKKERSTPDEARCVCCGQNKLSKNFLMMWLSGFPLGMVDIPELSKLASAQGMRRS
jgi:hypothetical protein